MNGFKQALADAAKASPVQSPDVIYPAGSIVVCYSCGVPLYRLTRSIYAGQPAGNPSEVYAPVRLEDLQTLLQRFDIDAGIKASIKLLTLAEQHTHCESVPWPLTNGMLTTCHKCGGSWTFYRTSADADGAKQFGDRAGVIQLATIPPEGRARRLTLVGR
jgi:hypothetical protein